jgi:heptosyltransferase-1
VLLTNASRATKLWPDAHWQAVQRVLEKRGFATVLFWGSDVEEADTRRRAAGMRGAAVAPRCTLNEVAAALSRARVIVGLDTGLTHLAAALGAPTVGIFCDYDPALVGVTGDARCESLGGAGGGPGADQVCAAIGRVLGELGELSEAG